jgi:hypothetical protein
VNKCIIFVCALFFTVSIFLYSDPIENQIENQVKNENKPGTFFMPLLSYTVVALDGIQAHNATGGLAVYRFNPDERDTLFAISMIYTPQVLTDTNHDFPSLYHSAVLSVIQQINRHTINGVFAALTDKPLYGGVRTFIGLAGYSYNLIKGGYFSMHLGANLVVMDLGVTLGNGTPWLLWAVPSIRLSWEYEWITFGFIPGAWMTIASKFPVSLRLSAGSHKYDASVWYRRFKNGNPSVEMVGIGVGIKRDSTKVMLSDGGEYGVNYNALYGSLRLLRFFEISGGWVFNGKEGYKDVNWETLFESAGYSNDTVYCGNIGGGFFISLSVRMSS